MAGWEEIRKAIYEFTRNNTALDKYRAGDLWQTVEVTVPGALLTAKELARALKVSLKTVRKLTATKKIPCVWVTPTTPRYSLPDVLKALPTE